STNKPELSRSAARPTTAAPLRDARIECLLSRAAGWHRPESRMIFSFGSREQFSNIVVVESGTEPERASLGAIRFSGKWLQNSCQADAQSGVDNIFERAAKFRGAFFCFRRDVWVKRQSGS